MGNVGGGWEMLVEAGKCWWRHGEEGEIKLHKLEHLHY